MTNKEKLLAFSALALLLTSGFPAMAEESNDSTPPAVSDQRPMGFGNGNGPSGDKPRGDPDKMAARQAEMQKRGAERFAKADKNGDGLLTKEEMLDAHKERLDEMFAETDTDKDGKLSREELQAGKMKMMKKFREKMGNSKDGFMGRNQDNGQTPPPPEEDGPPPEDH